MVSRFADFALTGQENQNVTLLTRMQPQLIDRIGNRVVQVVVFGLVERLVTLLDGEHTPRHLNDRSWSAFRLKMPRKPVCINRGRGHDYLQIRPPRQDLLEVPQQKIDVQRTLVRLVDDECVIGIEQRVGLGFGQQDAIGHQLDRRVAAKLVGKPHFVAHHLAQRRIELFGDAFGDAGRRNPPRLGVADQFAALTGRVIELAAPQAQRNLGQLGGFAGTGFAANDDHLVFGHQLGDFFAPL